MSEIVVNEANKWRLATPGTTGWEKSAHAGAPNKYLMISSDTHANEPGNLWAERIDGQAADRMPAGDAVEVHGDAPVPAGPGVGGGGRHGPRGRSGRQGRGVRRVLGRGLLRVDRHRTFIGQAPGG